MVNEYFKNRKTIRKYSSRPVDGELLRQLIEAAAEAPTTGGMQLYSVVVRRRSGSLRRTIFSKKW